MKARNSLQQTGRLDFCQPVQGGNPILLARVAVQSARETRAAESGNFCKSRLAHSEAQSWNLDESQHEDLKTIQELLRHATFKVTADTYTQAVTPVKREAQAKVAKLILADVSESKPITPTIQ
jgi:integrase